MSTKDFYLVNEGDVSAADPTTEWDGENSVLCYCDTQEQAIELAARYDRREIQPDNVYVQSLGKSVAALKF